jgi:hypothetical protein
MNLPRKLLVEVEENHTITNVHRRAREWCGSVAGAMVWLSSILPKATYVFRGHADATWNLESSLFRAKKPATLKELLRDEADLLKEVADDVWFRREFGFAPARSVRSPNYERTLAVLQHYRFPTRWLDATADPLVGLYFAAVGRSSGGDMDDRDGAVMLIRNVSAGDGLKIHVVAAPQISERVTAQRACFISPVQDATPGSSSADTVAFDFFNVSASNGSGTDFDNLVDNYLSGEFSGRPPKKAPNVLMFQVPKALKAACREVLRSMGISAKTLFPGSQGFREDLAGL